MTSTDPYLPMMLKLAATGLFCDVRMEAFRTIKPLHPDNQNLYHPAMGGSHYERITLSLHDMQATQTPWKSCPTTCSLGVDIPPYLVQEVLDIPQEDLPLFIAKLLNDPEPHGYAGFNADRFIYFIAKARLQGWQPWEKYPLTK